MRLLKADVLAGNAVRQWHADSGRPRTFILCEKKHEWVYSNVSTSLKKSIIGGSVTNVPECQTTLMQAFFSCNIKSRGLLQ